MDKETLSNYGWIVICVLVLAVMIALAGPFGNFVADAVKSTAQGLFDVNQGALDAAGITIDGQGFADGENGGGFGDTETNKPVYSGGNTQIDGVGAVDVETNLDKNIEFTYDNNTGIISGITPDTGNETAPTLPESVIPETIEFTFGSFESNTSTVTYETTVVETKKPVQYGSVDYAYWIYDKDGIKTPSEPTFNTFTFQLSDYVVYNKNTGKTISIEGQQAKVLRIYTLNHQGVLENAIYLAAYLNKTEGTKNNHIAKWNGTTYDEVNYDEQINAVTEFTRTRVIKEVKTVNTNTTPSGYTYVPTGTYKAEVGMTWRQWLTSDYNTTGKTMVEIKDSNFNNVSLDSAIQAGKQYGIAPEVEKYVLSGKWTFNDTLIIDTEMTQNINFSFGLEDSYNIATSNRMILYTEQWGFGDVITDSIYLSYGDKENWAFQQDFENGQSMDMNWFNSARIDFGTAPQEVSKPFYDWFMANATLGHNGWHQSD